MSAYLTPQQGAKELISRINESLKLLADEMRANAGRIRVDAIWEIPLREAGRVDASKPIVPVERQGIDAANLAIECLTCIWLRPPQNMRETLKAPGVVAMPGSFIAQIQESNHLRLELYNLMKPLTPAEREKIWRQHSNLSALQTQRITRVFEDPKRIRFYWDVSFSMRRIAAHDLAAEYSAMLIKLHGHDPQMEGLPEDSIDRKWARARNILMGLGVREPVAIYRPGQPHVRARIHDGLETPITPTSVPFVYDIDKVEKPKIVALGTYDPGKPKKAERSSRAKVEENPIQGCEKLFIHQYELKHRKPLPAPVDGEQKKHKRHQRNDME